MKKNKKVIAILEKHERTTEDNLFLIDNGVFTKKQLLLIYNTINNWTWDYALGKQPDGWSDFLRYDKEDSSNKNTKHYLIHPYIKHIEKKIGRREILKFYHIYDLGRNIFQFYYWWYFEDLFSRYAVRKYLRSNLR